ncbi:MAG: FtsK/SpoIIIE domain-containing protein, partial [Kineosporiaceae bacterium]
TVLEDSALVLRLAGAGVVALTGDRAAALGLVRAILLELALTCAPDDMRLIAAFPPDDLSAWEWAKWLPHTAPAGADPGSSERMLASSVLDLERHLDAIAAPRLSGLAERTGHTARSARPRAVVVIDRFDPLTELGVSATLAQTLAHAENLGITVLTLPPSSPQAPTETSTLITVGGAGGEATSSAAVLRRLREPSAAPVDFTPLAVDSADAERVARRLAPKRLVADSCPDGRVRGRRLADLLQAGLLTTETSGTEPPGAAKALAWPRRDPPDLLRVPVGIAVDGSPLELDLKESAEGGYGPHGLIVGAVGSGKSELLRTLVSGLAATHDPDDVETAFADFKGGLTFSLLREVSHCTGMITNLAHDLTLVDRMKAALAGELERRQQQLRAAGRDVQKIAQYRTLRRRHPDLPPMPYLVVVVDEFGELLEARPDVLEVLLSIGRTGRSLGVHLVLATQRFESGRTRGLDSYLGYRICLRTVTAEDSVAAVGSRVAADLPASPGHGYLRTASGLSRFMTATVSGSRQCDPSGPVVRPFPAAGRRSPGSEGDTSDDAREDSDLAVLVRETRRVSCGRRRPPLWLSPLPRPDDERPLTVADPRIATSAVPAAEGLPVAVGLVDLPSARRQVPLVLDPAALDGHLLVIGAPGSGKSTALASYAVQAATAFPSSLLQFHVLDLGGGGLAPLATLPNVGACVDGQDEDAVRRVVLACEQLLDGRGRRFGAHQVHSTAQLRELVASGDAPGPAHTVLLLDQLVSFRERFPDLDAALSRLLVEGPSAGVHIAMTSTRWAELPAKRLDQVSTRVELRLNDPLESPHGRAVAAAVPPGVPGRGLTGDGWVVQIAAPGVCVPPLPTSPSGRPPRAGGEPASVDLIGAVADAAAIARRRWPGVIAQPMRRLSDLAPGQWAEARQEATGQGALLFGIAESGFAPVTLDLRAGGGVLSYGDTGSGRTRFLARLLTESAALAGCARPRVYILDSLGALIDRCPDAAPVAAAAYTAREAAEVLAALTDELTRRHEALAVARRNGTPSPQPAPLWLIADDYELVYAAARPNLLGDLANLLPYSAGLGLTVLLNQVATGSGARVDPLVRRMLETNAWHVQFAVESRLELLLKGTRGVPLPAGRAILTRPRHADALIAALPPAAATEVEPRADAGRTRIRLVP